jgi:hypothetical protein
MPLFWLAARARHRRTILVAVLVDFSIIDLGEESEARQEFVFLVEGKSPTTGITIEARG